MGSFAVLASQSPERLSTGRNKPADVKSVYASVKLSPLVQTTVCIRMVLWHACDACALYLAQGVVCRKIIFIQTFLLNIHPYAGARTHTRTHARTHSRTHARTPPHTTPHHTTPHHTQTHTHTHTTHTHTHTHTHSPRGAGCTPALNEQRRTGSPNAPISTL